MTFLFSCLTKSVSWLQSKKWQLLQTIQSGTLNSQYVHSTGQSCLSVVSLLIHPEKSPRWMQATLVHAGCCSNTDRNRRASEQEKNKLVVVAVTKRLFGFNLFEAKVFVCHCLSQVNKENRPLHFVYYILFGKNGKH